ncbi:hypothetical protein BDQ17DRAFT_1428204 [Cyathus striatus]|nr:hypothetical protein BDQ17DRAFT_1428204 [Cyathus striatus]
MILTPLPSEIKEVREDLGKLVKDVEDVNEREKEERENAEERDREVVAYALEDMHAAQWEMEHVTAELDDAKIETVNVRSGCCHAESGRITLGEAAEFEPRDTQ